MISKTYLQRLRKLHNKCNIIREGRFLLQGEKCVMQVLCSSWKVDVLLCLESFFFKSRNLIEQKKIEYYIVSGETLTYLGNFESNNAAIAIVECKAFIPKITREPKLILDEMNNPGNLGTIIRTAEWFGIGEIVCSKNSVFFYNSKVLQASMGSFLNVEVSYTDLETYLPKLKIPIYAADLHGENINHSNPNRNVAILLGSESHGISSGLKKFTEKTIIIPPHASSKTESLNVGIAAGIICSKLMM